MAVDQRSHFHQELEALEQSTLAVAERAEEMAGMAVDALTLPDMGKVDQVLAADEELDRQYLDIHQRWINLMARQQPMGADLRLMSALLHLNVTLERTGDQCVNIAKLARVADGLPRNDRMVAQIREMGDLVRPMIRTAAEAFVRRDAEEARLLPAMDEPVDRINKRMSHKVVECSRDPKLLEWATYVMMASRALERIGDQAVDIAEQVVFLVTGEFLEFSQEAISERDDPG